jgi:hypothetical protein
VAHLLKLLVLLAVPLLVGLGACLGPRQAIATAEHLAEPLADVQAARTWVENAQDPLDAEMAAAALARSIDALLAKLNSLPAAPEGDEPLDWREVAWGVLAGILGVEATRRGAPMLGKALLARVQSSERPRIGPESEKP